MDTKHTPQPHDFAQKVKAGRGWLIVRNSATIAQTDYEARADEIVAALNCQAQRGELAAALRDARIALAKAGHHEGVSGLLIRIDAALAKEPI